MRTLRFFAVLSIAAACGAPSATSTAVEMGEFFIEAPNRLVAGSGELIVTNSGDFGHTLIVTRESGEVIAATDIVAPGGAATLDVDLPPGRYLITCRIVAQKPDGAVVDHFQEGMVSTVDVEA